VANLGAGAFAEVEWAVLRQPNGEDMNVAVKRLRPDLISSDQDLSDFVREGALLKRLNHP
jgi:serine/threonine protein kinase